MRLMDAHSWLPRSRKKFSGYLIYAQICGSGKPRGLHGPDGALLGLSCGTCCRCAAHLEGQQQADGLQALLPSVHVVAQEQVVRLWRETAILEQSQEV